MFSRRFAYSFVLAAAMIVPFSARTEQNLNNSISTGGILAAEQAVKGFDLPKGFKCEVVAADPLFGNPVAFSIDERGRFYVAETFRISSGVPDIRGRMHWLDTELASKTVEERIGYTKAFEPDNMHWWTNQTDRVSLIWDSDGDGRCDKSAIFATGFNDLADGIGAGVLARHGDVYYTDIPNLWLLRDSDGDNIADSRKILSGGYGVRYGFIGHDLHGLIVGPDGRLYFSIGDRGAHVTLPNGKILDNTESGAVFRCDLDGSNLEIFHTGLRNPQELAFDDFGNLWTCDNNSDAGDPARVVYVAEGGDSGWRVGWQFIEHPIARSSWLGERLCYEDFPDRAAYALPPVSSKVGNGPSGLTYDPGLGLPPEWRGRFFVANFSGNPNSGIFAFKVRPKGAGFELERNDRFWWNFLPTDVDFGYDGCLYAIDWINGWGRTGGTKSGRLYRLFVPEERNRPEIAGLKMLFAQGFEKISTADLALILAHQDRRVRQEAQFQLVTRNATHELEDAAAHNPNLLARLHAIWGLGQLERNGTRADVKELLADSQPEVRAQFAKILGDAKDDRYEKQIIKLLNDEEPRVRYFAALALGKFGHRRSVAPVIAMLRKSGDDPWLRHSGVMALDGCASESELASLADDSSVSVRLAAVVSLRQRASAKLQKFLADKNPRVVAEAARAINDLPVEDAMLALARLADELPRFMTLPAGSREQPTPRDAIVRRIINANFRLGGLSAELRLIGMISQEQLPDALRTEAISAFDHWTQPDGKDRVTGLWRPVPKRAQPDFVRYQTTLERVLNGPAPSAVKSALLKTAARWNWKELDKPAFALFQNSKTDVKTRVAVFDFLAAVKSPLLSNALKLATDSPQEQLRIAALNIASRNMTGSELVDVFGRLLDRGTLHERQSAYAMLGQLTNAAADRLLMGRLDDLLLGQTPAEVQLDLIEAAAKRTDPQVKSRYEKFIARQATRSGASGFSECLKGGDAANGKKIFREHQQATCLRCHMVSDEGGVAGPDLTHVASRGDRNYLLESITYPNAKIATGFENIQVVLTNGVSATGIVKRETDSELDLYSLEDGLVTVKKSEIKTRTKTLSGMPDNMREILTRREIRDLVEYLSSLK